MNDRPGLQILALQKRRDSQRLGLRRTGLDGLLLLLLLLLLLAHLCLVLLHGLLFKFGNVFGDGHAVLFGFYGELALHLCDLLGRGLLAWRRRSGHALRRADLWFVAHGERCE
jgi:hypothetical protein